MRTVMFTGAFLALAAPVAAQDAVPVAAAIVVASTQRPPAGFVPTVPGRAVFAMLGAAASVAAGKELVREHGIVDPAGEMSGRLASGLAEAKSGTVAPQPLSLDGWKPAEVAKAAGEAAYVVDAQTTGWSLIYFPTDWSHYRVMYSARLRVLDVRTRQVVADAKCSQETGKDGAPTHDELLADGAALLKQHIGELSGLCEEAFKAEVAKL